MTRVLAALCAGFVLASCGDDDEPERPLRPVRLEVMQPADAAVVKADSVDVRGRVEPPKAQVLVRGERAEMDGAAFSARVDLEEGANVVDVTASARGRAPTLTAIRVIRRVTVTVPDVVGLPRDEAVKRLEDEGLRARVKEEDGFLDWLQPGDRRVCEMDPDDGDEVDPGTRVELVVAKDC